MKFKLLNLQLQLKRLFSPRNKEYSDLITNILGLRKDWRKWLLYPILIFFLIKFIHIKIKLLTQMTWLKKLSHLKY